MSAPAPSEAARPKRDARVETYRLLLMLGIVLLHAITMSPYPDEKPLWLTDILRSAVNGFVIITGWYGVRFAPSKVVRLFALLGYSVAVQWLAGRFFGAEPLGTTPWFLYAYLFMMLLAPLVDAVLARTDNRHLASVFVPFALLLLWSGALETPTFAESTPETPGLGSYTGLTLLGCYVVGRLARRFALDEKIPTPALLISWAALLWLVQDGWGNYASPYAYALALVSFLAVKRFAPAIPGVRFIAPSLFVIYLLHTNEMGYRVIRFLERFFRETHGLSYGATITLTALTIFVGAFALDLPRRALAALFRPILRAASRLLDDTYTRLIGALPQKV